jgi:hypothetical protein
MTSVARLCYEWPTATRIGIPARLFTFVGNFLGGVYDPKITYKRKGAAGDGLRLEPGVRLPELDAVSFGIPAVTESTIFVLERVIAGADTARPELLQ